MLIRRSTFKRLAKEVDKLQMQLWNMQSLQALHERKIEIQRKQIRALASNWDIEFESIDEQTINAHYICKVKK